MSAAIKERPILSSGEMVRAILSDRKTQTRRIVKPPPKVVHALYHDASIDTERIFPNGDQRIHCPYGVPGDLLWVRETWQEILNVKECSQGKSWDATSTKYVFAADGEKPFYGKWRPSIHMPRGASRINMEITSIDVERLQDISEADAVAEGCHVGAGAGNWRNARHRFEELWDSINIKRAPWASNPYVWVIEFKRIAK